MAFQCAYMECFAENPVFAYFKRVTAAGVSNILGRVLIIFSPLVAEAGKPVPEIIMIVVLVTALIFASFLPTTQEEREFAKAQCTGCCSDHGSEEDKKDEKMMETPKGGKKDDIPEAMGDLEDDMMEKDEEMQGDNAMDAMDDNNAMDAMEAMEGGEAMQAMEDNNEMEVEEEK